ncbi:MAG: flagellin hook IN motif-containing protein [Myxococcota bacterium]|nr:flagellin hook IN motif-containing protein [Myxococcota bacterium]
MDSKTDQTTNISDDYFISIGLNSDSKVVGQVVRDLTDGISLVQTADSGLMDAAQILLDLRRLAQEGMRSNLSQHRRTVLGVESQERLDEFDAIGRNTRFGSLAPLNGQLLSLRLRSRQYGAEDMTVNFLKLRRDSLGLHISQIGNSVDATRPITADSIEVNDVGLRATTSADDTVSVINNSASALAKVRVFNEVSDQTGVTAYAQSTRVDGGSPGGGQLDALNPIRINGETFQGFEVRRDDYDGRLRSTINSATSRTGVRADLIDGRLQLTADDGRNIYVETATIKAAEATGLNAGRAAQQVFGGRVKLFARQSFELEYKDVGMDDAVGLGPVIGPESVLSNPKTALSQMDLSSSFTSRQAVDSINFALEEIDINRDQLSDVLERLQMAAESKPRFGQTLELSRNTIVDFSAANDVLGLARSQISQFSSLSIFAQANSEPKNAYALLQDKVNSTRQQRP